MALQARQIHVADPQKPRICRSVWRVTTPAAFGLYRNMLVNERPSLISVTLKTNRITVGHGAHLSQGPGTVDIVAVAALDKSFVDPVAVRLGKICLGGRVTAVTQSRLLFDEQKLFCLGVMGRVAVNTTDIAV